MPEPWSGADDAANRYLERALEKVLASDEISLAAVAQQLDIALIRHRIADRKEVVVESVKDARSALEESAQALGSAEEALDKRKQSGKVFAASVLVVIPVLIVVVVAVQAVISLFIAARPWIEALIAMTEWWVAALLAFVLLSSLLSGGVISRRLTARYEWELALPQLRAGMLEASRRLEEAVSSAVLRQAREEIAVLARPGAVRELATGNAPGLSELHADDFDVPTVTYGELDRLLTVMRGGSIGLAGPRGVGKTTLLRSFSVGGEGVLGVLVPAPVRYDAKEFFIYLFERLCETVVGPLPDALLLNDPLPRAHGLVHVGRVYRRALRRIAGYPEPIQGPLGERGGLREVSVSLLRELRWQRSYTTGVGAEVALTSALKINRSSDRQATRLPWSLPQLVHELRGHLERLASEERVIIAIDELDKISAADDAAGFLNDFKAIFGLPAVFFLISVSEDAMANFERRGQPVRDAFDSAFDHILTVPPLSYEECATMLRRRVIGMPWPFVALATAMGGGLPREVIRVARQCVIARDDVGSEFDCILSRVIDLELAGLMRGTTHAVAARRGEPGANEVLSWLSSIKGLDSQTNLQIALHDLERLTRALSGDEQVVASATLLELLLQVRSRILFSITLMQVLDPKDAKRFERAVEDGWIDSLAGVRAAFSLGALISLESLAGIREALGLDEPR